MTVRKITVFILTGIMCISLLAGCGSQKENGSAAEKAERNDTVQIVATIFPEYDWVKEILGDEAEHAELTLLLDSGVDLHSYQPTAQDIRKIAECDLFLYVGGESDEWLEKALGEAPNPDRIVINLLETLGDAVKEEEIVEGMEADDHDHDEAGHDDEEHDEEEHDDKEHDHDDDPEYDEHVWLSLKNASVLVGAISEALGKADPAHQDVYAANAAAYQEQLSALDKEYENAVNAASKKTVLFGDRFPFRYLTDDYGLTYYAAFVGCSAETEASFETILFLANKVDEEGLGTILTIEGENHRIARTISENTTAKNQKILVLDSMQSTTSADASAGASYISIMKSNLEVLKEALG